LVLPLLITTFITLIDTAWKPLLAVRGVSPDLILSFVLFLTVLFPKKSFVLAFWAGLLKDILTGGLWGVNATVLLLIAGSAVLIKDRLFQYRPLTWLVLVAGGTMVYVRSFPQFLYNLAVFVLYLTLGFKLVSKKPF